MQRHFWAGNEGRNWMFFLHILRCFEVQCLRSHEHMRARVKRRGLTQGTRCRLMKADSSVRAQPSHAAWPRKEWRESGGGICARKETACCFLWRKCPGRHQVLRLDFFSSGMRDVAGFMRCYLRRSACFFARLEARTCFQIPLECFKQIVLQNSFNVRAARPGILRRPVPRPHCSKYRPAQFASGESICGGTF